MNGYQLGARKEKRDGWVKILDLSRRTIFLELINLGSFESRRWTIMNVNSYGENCYLSTWD